MRLTMKKIVIISGVLATVALGSCKPEVCIKCTPITGQPGEEQNLCSKDADDRREFQQSWIMQSYNCTEVTE